MPIFEYRCGRCGAEVGLLVRSHDPEPSRCDSCKRGRLKRVISRFSVGGRPAETSALQSSPRDWLDRPERFGQAMKAFEQSSGTRFSGERVDDAMHRLSQARKAAL
ncbi:MAG TPA: zinc ribbon domain-containing protein [Candidatus Binataceae bacterium]|nr:zinc ribbon domain-containing protein [Candidatus Binataceae bacterium]